MSSEIKPKPLEDYSKEMVRASAMAYNCCKEMKTLLGDDGSVCAMMMGNLAGMMGTEHFVEVAGACIAAATKISKEEEGES